MYALTVGVILCFIVGLVAYDVWAYTHNVPTVSRVMQDALWSHPVYPLALGILIGHWIGKWGR